MKKYLIETRQNFDLICFPHQQYNTFSYSPRHVQYMYTTKITILSISLLRNYEAIGLPGFGYSSQITAQRVRHSKFISNDMTGMYMILFSQAYALESFYANARYCEAASKE